MSLRLHAVASAGACLGAGTKAVCPSVVANSKATKPTARTSLGVFPYIQAGAYRDMQSWDHHLFLMIYRYCRKRVLITCTINNVCVCVHILSWSFHDRMVHVASGKQPFPSRPHQTSPRHWQVDWTLFSPGSSCHLQPMASSHALWPYPWLPCGCAPWSWSHGQATIHPTTTNLI